MGRQCYISIIKGKRPLNILPIDGLDQWKEESPGESIKQLILILLKEDDLIKTMQIGSLLDENLLEDRMAFLQKNMDIFA